MGEIRRWTCEWGGMRADIEAESRSKARYQAFRILHQYWGLNDLREIRVTISKPGAEAPLTEASRA